MSLTVALAAIAAWFLIAAGLTLVAAWLIWRAVRALLNAVR